MSYKFINKNYIQDNEYVKNYKVIVPKSNGNGDFGEVLSSPIVMGPNEVSTDTFLSVGPVVSMDEANAILKYLKSKFLRSLLGVKKVTQDNPRSVWQLIPMQDFTDTSDIDWSQSINEIDHQLYKKYHLTYDEIKFIEDNVQAME